MLTGHSGSNAHFISPPSASMNNKQKSHPMQDRLGIPFPIAVAYCRLHIRDRGEDVAFRYLPPFRLPLPWHFCHPPWLRGTVLVANRVNLSLHLWPPTELDKLIWCSVDTKGVEHSLQAQVDIEMLFRAGHIPLLSPAALVTHIQIQRICWVHSKDLVLPVPTFCDL